MYGTLLILSVDGNIVLLHLLTLVASQREQLSNSAHTQFSKGAHTLHPIFFFFNKNWVIEMYFTNTEPLLVLF